MRKKYALIAIISVVTMLIGALYARIVIRPVYTSHIKVYVENNGDGLQGQNMISSSLIFLEEDLVLQSVAEGMEGKYTLNQVRDMVEVQQIEDSLFVEISATAPLPEDAQKLCNLTASQGKLMIETITGLQNIDIIGEAATPVEPSSLGMKECGFIGFLVGFVFSSVGLLVPVFAHNKVRGRKNTMRNFDVPFFGEVPSFDSVGKGIHE